MKIGFIGGGNMAEALIKGMPSRSRENIYVSDPTDSRRTYLESQYNISSTESNCEIAQTCDIIIIAVKPQIMDAVTDEVSSHVTDSKTIVSIAAGITLTYLSSKFSTKKIIRVMPNTPALVQRGMTVMSLCECFSDRDINVIREIFMSIGEVITLPEKHMDAVTALSGSGPAFFALFVESMITGGEQLGLSSDDARRLAVQTAIGTSALLETGMSPSELREMVTSPGGTTAAGLSTFHELGFSSVVSAAMKAAQKRSIELGSSR